MNALAYFAPQLAQPRPGPAAPDTEIVPLKAVVLYDLKDAGIRGMAFLRRVLASGENGLDVQHNVWPLGVIDHPICRDAVRHDLLEADMVIFAMDEAANLAACHAPWFEACQSRRVRALPLVVTLTAKAADTL
jgi:hypothetical protein